jgi:hypothetical protein
MSDQQPATKADLTQAIDALETRLESRLTAAMREIETNLLRAFHSYAERADLRLRTLETTESFTVKRIADLEAGGLWADLQRRIIELERRLPPNTPQH